MIKPASKAGSGIPLIGKGVNTMNSRKRKGLSLFALLMATIGPCSRALAAAPLPQTKAPTEVLLALLVCAVTVGVSIFFLMHKNDSKS